MILGIDPGSRRIGLAVADPETRFARPLDTLDATGDDPAGAIARLASELGVTLVVVGRPVGLSGRAGPAVDAQQSFVSLLKERLAVPVVEHDERLTTVIAEQGLRASGAKWAARKDRRDAVAAQVMLQGYLDSHP